MCGIAGYYSPRGKPISIQVLENMTRSLAYRGPDAEGFYHQDGIGLGHRRLSVIDIAGGSQPMANADQSLIIVFNGEIFNYIELREELKGLGHLFHTQSDTETILNGYEEWGAEVFSHLNGQFAVALWDKRKRALVLGRDRFGIRPLFHATIPDGSLIFASEMKALFRFPDIKAQIDPKGVSQIFTFWANVPPRTVFQGVQELAPGHLLVLSPEKTELRPFWKHTFPRKGDYAEKDLRIWSEEVRHVLDDATALQLRSDVPVASYLSGGLDSSIISALIKKFHNRDLITFSVGFQDPNFDESFFQRQMADHLGTDHRRIDIGYREIGESFSDVIRLSEKPMLRTAPAPLLRLSRLVRDSGIKVVLTGEGADEIFAGYSIFREDKVRRFWARQPLSTWRPLLLNALHPEAHRQGMASNFWISFFKKGLTELQNPYYSHSIRWANTSQLKLLFAPDFRASMGDEDSVYADLDAFVAADFKEWHPLCRAQYLEMVLFMSGNLLCSQGDRMLMGNSVEGRMPFLDHRLVELAARIPPKYKISILQEKFVLKNAYRDLIPAEILNRPKQPYRAPISPCFFNGEDTISARAIQPGAIAKTGYFEPAVAQRLLHKAQKVVQGEGRLSERDDMAVVGMVSLQLLHHHFIESLD